MKPTDPEFSGWVFEVDTHARNHPDPAPAPEPPSPEPGPCPDFEEGMRALAPMIPVIPERLYPITDEMATPSPWPPPSEPRSRRPSFDPGTWAWMPDGSVWALPAVTLELLEADRGLCDAIARFMTVPAVEEDSRPPAAPEPPPGIPGSAELAAYFEAARAFIGATAAHAADVERNVGTFLDMAVALIRANYDLDPLTVREMLRGEDPANPGTLHLNRLMPDVFAALDGYGWEAVDLSWSRGGLDQ